MYRPYKWIALSCTTLGAIMSVLNGSTLMIALPSLMKELGASLETVVWILMSYMLAITVLVPSIGRIADMFGRKNLYVGGFAVFTLGSLVCGFARTGEQLLALRMIQAVGGSLILANSTAIVTDAFPRGELGQALGINSMVIAVGSILGPILGGYLTTLGWRWIFWFNVPLGVLGTLWARTQLREVVSLPEHQKFDWSGTISFTLGLFSLLFALSLGPMMGWLHPLIGGAFVLALGLLALFVWWEGHTPQPMLDLSLFRNRLLAAAYGSILLNGIARGAVTFLLIFYFHGVKGLNPVQAGIMLTPFALSMMVASPISGWLADRHGSRELSSVGLFVSALGLVGLAHITAWTSTTQLALWMAIMGLGSGMFNSPNTSAIMGAVMPERRGVAAGTRTMMNNTGAVVSMALGLAVTASSMTPQAMQSLFSGTMEASQATAGAGMTTAGAGIAVHEFIGGLHLAFWVSVGLSLIAAVISLMRGPAATQPDATQRAAAQSVAAKQPARSA